MLQWFYKTNGLQALRDLIDIFVVAFIIYHILKLIRGTRAVYMLIGLSFGVVIYVFSNVFELATLNWVLYHLLGSFLLIIVVLFQNEIRRALTRIGRTPVFSFLGAVQDTIVIDELIKASVSLANKKIGALIVIEKEANVQDYVEEGVVLDAQVSKELLISLFLPSSPLHDGAVLIQKGKLAAASCFLPLSMNPELEQDLGTRHRAAIGLTEETDALVIVVSEEKGWISVSQGGKVIRGIDAIALRKIIHQQFQSKVSSWLAPIQKNKEEDTVGEVEV
ncbi:MAG: diadenylate cyclase CdaA [Deltaproteobacteria bacterium]|nr:diadenylate cyclase CdaA [Deltaproteobacteria bacterium]